MTIPAGLTLIPRVTGDGAFRPEVVIAAAGCGDIVFRRQRRRGPPKSARRGTDSSRSAGGLGELATAWRGFPPRPIDSRQKQA